MKEIKGFCDVLQWHKVRSKFREKRPNDSKADRSGHIASSLIILLFTFHERKKAENKR
jgi:hypothetical protein